MKSPLHRWPLLVILALALTPQVKAASAVEELGPEDFLKQVRERHANYQAAVQQAEAAADETSSADLLYSPAFFTNLTYTDDKSPTLSRFQSPESKTSSLTTGFTQNTSWGMNATLSYSLLNSDYTEANPLAPIHTFNPSFGAGFRFKITQSLWQNGFGRETRASVNAIRAGSLADSAGKKFKNTMLLAEAEGTYWQLSAAREMVRIQSERLARAEAMRKWSERQVKLSLADKSSLLQTQAAEQAARLELERAKSGAREAALKFNGLRGIESAEVTETLQPLARASIKAPKETAKAPVRDDIVAAEQVALAAQAAAQKEAEEAKPKVDLFAEYGRAGLDPHLNPALSGSVADTNPYASVGVEIQLPLDFGARSRVLGAKQARVEAADKDLAGNKFEAEVLWTNLHQQLDEVKSRLDVVEKLETIQKDKLERERELQDKGRSTTFQVIQFEQDYLQAQLARVQTLAEAMQVAIQLRTYQRPEAGQQE